MTKPLVNKILSLITIFRTDTVHYNLKVNQYL